MDQQPPLYVGLDVSLEATAICVVDEAGRPTWRGKAASTPEAIAAVVGQHAPGAVRIGLETGQLSNWLTLGLHRLGLPVVCLDARHAKATLALQLNKTDANDALGLAQVVRTGWYREVAVKGGDATTLRTLLVARAGLITQRQAVANNIRGILKSVGLVIPRGAGAPFVGRVREAVEGHPALAAIVEPLLVAWSALREGVLAYDRQVIARAKVDRAARLLMTIPGVGEAAS